MDTLTNLQTKLRETIERYRNELPGTEATGGQPDGTNDPTAPTTGEPGTDRGEDTDDPPERKASRNGPNDTNGANGTNGSSDGNDTNKAKAAGKTGANGKTPRTGGKWHAAESPTNKSLQSVTTTAAGPFAVGTGGRVLRRGEEGWHLVVETGPATRKNRLTAIDTTSDGKRVWFCGSSGALGAYDVDSGRKYDYSAPKDKTSTWEAIAVTGKRDAERVRVANGSGEVLPARLDEKGCPKWGEVTKPGSGSTIAALDFGGGRCYAVDTSGNVFEESATKGKNGTNGTKNGEVRTWTDIGIENAQVNFFDVFATDSRVLVAGGGGRVYRYDRPCGSWTPIDAGDGALYAIDGDEKRTIVVGTGGRIYERLSGNGWCERDSSVMEDLRSVALGASAEHDNRAESDKRGDGSAGSGGVTDVAVGTNGTIIERTPGGTTE